MIPKVIQYEDPMFENTFEPRVRLLDAHRGHLGHVKHASCDVNDYLSTVSPVPGKRYVLVLAMSASEYYGPNRNGDGFSENPVFVNGDYAVRPGETLVDHYKTFETHANVFRHHINKDPAKGFGTPDKAFYNFDMHRVELLLELEEHKCSDIITKLDSGDFPGVSMGCRIKYDVCSICGNQAPTREQYCEHVNGMNPEFGMNQLLEDGRKCFVWNPNPTLFDISFVFKPADRIGYTMRKVAGADPYAIKEASADIGARVEDLKQKRAALKKISEIDKIIHGEVVDPKSSVLGASQCRAAESMAENILPHIMPRMGDLPEDLLGDLSGMSMPKILSSMSACGIVPSGKELHIIISKKHGVKPDDAVGDMIGMAQGALADALSDAPKVLDELEKTGLLKMGQELVDVYAVNRLKPYMEKRALWEDYLAREHIPESYGPMVAAGTGAFDADNAYYRPATDNLHYRDPDSGRTYQTTRNAAEQADWYNTKKKMIEGTGATALLGLGVKALGASNKWKWLQAPSLVGGGLGITHMMAGQNVPEVETAEGVRVPANTEFVEKRGEVGNPISSGALATFLIAQDQLRSNPGRDSKSLYKAGHVNRVNGPNNVSRKREHLRRRFKQAMYESTRASQSGPHQSPDVDLESLIEKIGTIIVENA